MKCRHCKAELTEEEIKSDRATAQIHGIEFGLCNLCWKAWGTSTFGWQAGTSEVSFSDRLREWNDRENIDQERTS